MSERRLLSMSIMLVAAAIAAPFEPEGIAFYGVVSAITTIALLGGNLGAEWLQARRRRIQH